MAPIPINKIAKPNETPKTRFWAPVIPMKGTEIFNSLGIATKDTKKIKVNNDEDPNKAATCLSALFAALGSVSVLLK